MATTQFFHEIIVDQGGINKIELEIGRSSFYAEDSIYLNVDGKSIVMNKETAIRFVESVVDLGKYHGFID